MSSAAPVTMLMRVRRVWDKLAIYLPLVVMALIAMTTYWLVRTTPNLDGTEDEAPLRHAPDYFMQNFSLKVFGEDGRLKSEMVGVAGRHYPDTDTLEIDEPYIRVFAAEGRITTAIANRALVNGDGSEAQLFEKAVIVREATTNAQGVISQRSELHSEFLHLFADTEQVRSHLPVVMVRGAGDRFTADGLGYDNLNQTVQLNGRVRGTLMPRKDKAAK
jgi:lipopolysaccharide export system protein LptC